MKYRVVSNRSLELERGEKIAIEPQPLETGKLYLFQIGALLILGRWVSGWIVQPDRWIKIGKVAVTVLGVVRHLLL